MKIRFRAVKHVICCKIFPEEPLGVLLRTVFHTRKSGGVEPSYGFWVLTVATGGNRSVQVRWVTVSRRVLHYSSWMGAYTSDKLLAGPLLDWDDTRHFIVTIPCLFFTLVLVLISFSSVFPYKFTKWFHRTYNQPHQALAGITTSLVLKKTSLGQ